MDPAIGDVREQKAPERCARRGNTVEEMGTPYLSEPQWARSARATAKTAIPGTTSRTTNRGHARTDEARTGSVDCATTSNALRWHCGMSATLSLQPYRSPQIFVRIRLAVSRDL